MQKSGLVGSQLRVGALVVVVTRRWVVVVAGTGSFPAWRIDSPELHEIAVRMKTGIESQGRDFHDLSAEELTDLSSPFDR